MEILSWIVLVGMAVAMYIIIYKYERRMEALDKQIREHQDKLDEHHGKISKNREHIDENFETIGKHDNHIQQMWVTIPKASEEDNEG